MAQFRYQAKKINGEIYERFVEAPDRLALYKIIREEGGTIVSIHEVKDSRFPLLTHSFRDLFSDIKTQDKINFAKNLGSMIKAGLPITRALDVLAKQAAKKPLQSLFSDLETDVNHGLTLSQALAKKSHIFSPLFISMVKAGEESGAVVGSLLIVSSQMDKSYQLAKKIRGAMIYPSIIISVMIGLSVLLLIFMVPTLTATFAGLGASLPLSTRILIALSTFLVNHTILMIAVSLLLIFSIFIFWKSEIGRRILDRIYLHLPVVGEMAREIQVERSSRTLSSLLSAGVDIVIALGVTSDVVQNHLYKNTLMDARSAIQKGELLSAVFARYGNLYPLFMSEMTAVGEETGKIAEMLMGVADYYEREIDQKTKDLSTIIEPVLMIIIGLGVGIFAISMLAPTYSLVDYIK